MKIESNNKEIKIKFDKLKKAALINLKKVIASDQRVFVSYMRDRFLRGGTTETRLRRRSGHLARSLQAQPVEIKGTHVEGRVTIGTAYSRVHVGPKSQETTIRSKRPGGYLTIPIKDSPIMTKAGVVKATAKELMSGAAGLPFGRTFIYKGIIYGSQRITKGPKIGKYTKQLIPLFILKKQVKIPSRVHPEIFLPWIEKQIVNDLKKEGFKSSG